MFPIFPDPSIILSKVCPQANVIASADAQLSAASVVSTTPSVVIAVDGTSFIKIDKGSHNNSDNKTNSTNPFKTDIFTKILEPDTPLYFKDPPHRVVSTNKRN